MALNLYDKAVVDKIKRWVKDANATITSPGETRRLFEYRADITNDAPIQLPLIAVRRDPSVTIRNPYKNSKTFDGAVIQATTQRIELLNVVPISINYQLDIYCRYQEEADEYARNFIFNLINYPKLTVDIPYNDSNIIHDSNINLGEELLDNSDIPERLIPGQFTRYTIMFTVNDAYLFSVPIRNAITISAETEIKLAGQSNV